MGGWANFWLVEGTLPHPPNRENPVLITFAPESFWILFHIPKVILKLYLDGKLQVTLAYYLSYKRDFSYCQTLRILKWFVPLMRCQTLYMWKYDSSSNSYSSSKFWSVPDICCRLRLAIVVSIFFKLWSYKYSKSYMATFLGMSLPE